MASEEDRIKLLAKYREKMMDLETLPHDADAMTFIDAMTAMKRAANKCRDAGIDEEVLWQIRRAFLAHAEFMTDER